MPDYISLNHSDIDPSKENLKKYHVGKLTNHSIFSSNQNA